MPRGTEVAKKATFTTDDKRAQYARLIAFNHGVQKKIIPKDRDVNSATNTELEKALKDLAGGNMLEGPGGIEIIMKLSQKGSTTGRPLTKAYAQEVRPFLRRMLLSPDFGRRASKRSKSNGGTKAKADTKKSTPKAGKKSSSKKGGTASRSSSSETMQEPEAEVPVEEPAVTETPAA